MLEGEERAMKPPPGRPARRGARSGAPPRRQGGRSLATEPGARDGRPIAVTDHRRRRAPARYLFLIIAVAALAAGCGTTSGPASGSGSSASPAAKVALSFAVRENPGAKPTGWTLTCDPAGGTVSDASAACTTLLALKKPFATPPGHQICPNILRSSGQITVTGTWFGEKIHRVVRDGGCDFALYGTLTKILR